MNNIDFNLQKQIRLKYKTNFPKYDSDYWVKFDKREQCLPLNIQKISTKNNFKKNKYFVLDFYNFFENYENVFSFRTLSDKRTYLKFFIDFLNKEYKNITSFNEINYNVLLSYSNYLQNKKNNERKYLEITSFLKYLCNVDSNLVHQDIVNFKIPKIKFRKNVEKREYYTEEEFSQVVKIIIYFLKEFLSGNKNISENEFVKFSYWFFACCTGFNKTALNNLNLNSIEKIEDNKYLIIGEKNRSNLGYQHITLKIPEKDTLFNSVYNKLIEINKQNKKHLSSLNKDALFVLSNQNYIKDKLNSYKYIRYNGNVNFLLNKSKTKSKIENLGMELVLFSTLKIRNNWSNKIINETNNFKIASKMLNHKNENILVKNYLNNKISKQIQQRFNLFQELLYCYAENKNYQKWIEFQKAFNLNKKTNEIIIKEIQEGVFDTFTGKCLNSFDNPCRSYLKCFECENYSIIGDKDLWKVLSLKELLKTEKDNQFFNKYYSKIIENIDEILNDFEEELIHSVKNLFYKFGLHPFFKNEKVFKKIIEDFERSIINE